MARRRGSPTALGTVRAGFLCRAATAPGKSACDRARTSLRAAVAAAALPRGLGCWLIGSSCAGTTAGRAKADPAEGGSEQPLESIAGSAGELVDIVGQIEMSNVRCTGVGQESSEGLRLCCVGRSGASRSVLG
jgi:hypothetical protein